MQLEVLGETARTEPEDGLAVEVLVAAAERLRPAACEQLARRLLEHLLKLRQDHAEDLCPAKPRRERMLAAVRIVARSVGVAPTTRQYQAEDLRRQDQGEPPLPSTSTVIREFGSWAGALAAAGLVPGGTPTAFQRRLKRQRYATNPYTPERMRECLRACARDLGRVPMVRDHVAWREEALNRRRPSHQAPPDIPHFRTYYQHYGSWGAALAAAGLDPDPAARTRSFPYSVIPRANGNG